MMQDRLFLFAIIKAERRWQRLFSIILGFLLSIAASLIASAIYDYIKSKKKR